MIQKRNPSMGHGINYPVPPFWISSPKMPILWTQFLCPFKIFLARFNSKNNRRRAQVSSLPSNVIKMENTNDLSDPNLQKRPEMECRWEILNEMDRSFWVCSQIVFRIRLETSKTEKVTLIISRTALKSGGVLHFCGSQCYSSSKPCLKIEIPSFPNPTESLRNIDHVHVKGKGVVSSDTPLGEGGSSLS